MRSPVRLLARTLGSERTGTRDVKLLQKWNSIASSVLSVGRRNLERGNTLPSLDAYRNSLRRICEGEGQRTAEVV